ncbi:MAG: membrane protein insertion efficiency factor YidD [Algicola sp.]|nr:membrane protein insertion efficiency factor YidD [Algicola sp.]
MVKRFLLAAIRWYQRSGGSRQFFSLDCNFEPSCSEYTKQAIERYGTVKGVRLGWSRIRRCNDPDCVKKIQDPLV